MDDDSQEILINDTNRVDAEIQRIYDALDAITAPTAPTDPEPEAVAEFARTPETRQALGDVLPPDELAALDRDLELYEALADLDLTGDDPKPTAPNPARLELIRRTRDELVADALANGWRAQARREIDRHRAGVGKDDYNATRRANRHLKAIEEGRDFTPRGPRGQTSPEGKREQTRSRVAEFRKKERVEAKALGISVNEYQRRKRAEKDGATF